jgi:D-alanine-D-alanine ligase
LGLRDLSRSDFLVSSTNEVVLLEVNTMPGMTPTSLYPDAARAAGLSFGDLMDKLVVNAVSRTMNVSHPPGA